MHDFNVAERVMPHDDSDVSVAGIKDKVAGKRLRPRNRRTVSVLRRRAAAVTDEVRPAADVVEHPIHEAGAVQSERANRSRTWTARRSYSNETAA